MQRFWVFAITYLVIGYHVTALNLPRDPTITPAPIVPKDLFNRDIATCGWIRGNASYPLTCQVGYTCTSKQGFLGQQRFACCNDVECPGDWQRCTNEGDDLCGAYEDAAYCSSVYGSILSCSAANPSCFLYAKSYSLGASSTWYSFACGQASTNVLVLASITRTGEKISSTSTNANANANANANPTIFGGSPPTETSSTSSGQSPTTTSSSSSNNIWKIIVAGAVGGVILIVVVVTAMCYLWQQRTLRIKKAVDPPGPPTAEYQQSAVSNWVNELTPYPPPPAPSTAGRRTIYDGRMLEYGRS